MLLAVDIGNSNIVFGFFHSEEWRYLWRMETGISKAVANYEIPFNQLLLENDLDPGNVRKIIISSVVPPLTPIITRMLKNIFRQDLIIIGPDIYPKLKIQITNPYEIGSDLVANAVAAYEMFGQSCIVVDFGTALTFTTISDSGKILGVAIAPGLQTAIRSLSQETSKLPEVPLKQPDSALGKDTVHAIQAGVLIGYAGLVDHMLKIIKKELVQPYKVVATGGLSSILSSVQDQFDLVDPYLTLNGLKLMAISSE